MKTADTVHVPSIGEDWLVAFVENGWVTCCGFPESRVRVEECRLVREATAEEESELLLRMSRCDGPRGAYARWRLDSPTKEPR